MNKQTGTESLTAKHLEAVQINVKKYGSEHLTGSDEAASACTSITVEAMMGFERWKIDNGWRFHYYDYFYYKSGNPLHYTTEELINLYLNQK